MTTDFHPNQRNAVLESTLLKIIAARGHNNLSGDEWTAMLMELDPPGRQEIHWSRCFVPADGATGSKRDSLLNCWLRHLVPVEATRYLADTHGIGLWFESPGEGYKPTLERIAEMATGGSGTYADQALLGLLSLGEGRVDVDALTTPLVKAGRAQGAEFWPQRAKHGLSLTDWEACPELRHAAIFTSLGLVQAAAAYALHPRVRDVHWQGFSAAQMVCENESGAAALWPRGAT